ncbi:MAG TPA: ABC transporter substrate-binding protein, partial [Anaerolineae bacterium]|nr:ABC transporter substrate-binding protein [Anaerolineae bacterium]
MSRRAILKVFVILMIASLVAACGPTPEPQTIIQTVEVEKTVVETVEVEVPAEAAKPSGETIRIGGVGPLSAPGTVVGGIAMQFAMNLAVQDINEAGGVLGKPLELIFADTEGLPERGGAVVERLINENGVVAITGEYHSAVGLVELE